MASIRQSAAQKAEHLAASGRAAEAEALLEKSIAEGDVDACFLLATWRLSGNIVTRDLALSRALFKRASFLGRADAAAIHTAFVANGTGGASDWREALLLLETRASSEPKARRQLDVIREMDLLPDGGPREQPRSESLSEAPQVSIVRNLFTPMECDYLISAAEPLFQPSVIVHPMSGRLVQNPIRTSDGAVFPFVLEDPAIHALNRRIAATTATNVGQGEPLQVLRYDRGQEYKPHLDALPPGIDNPRTMTVLVYLNESYKGGETRFLRTGLTVRGRVGDAVLFRNMTANGEPDENAIHAGLPVTQGRKLIASRWIRARPLDLSGPARAD
ncbi:MAG TPA: 2OG-Fe(II) oxygenase [Allosphingosinicella sp.]|jgi:prolyl 4-hydroxylase